MEGQFTVLFVSRDLSMSRTALPAMQVSMPRKPHVSPATADAPIMGLRRPWAGNYWPPGHTHTALVTGHTPHWAVRRVRGPASPRWSAHTWATFTGLGFSCDNQGLAACACLYLSMAVSQEGWSKWGSGGRNCLVISVGLCTCAGRAMAPHTPATAQLFLSCPGDQCAPLTCYWHADNVCGLQPPPDSSVTTSVSVGTRRGEAVTLWLRVMTAQWASVQCLQWPQLTAGDAPELTVAPQPHHVHVQVRQGRAPVHAGQAWAGGLWQRGGHIRRGPRGRGRPWRHPGCAHVQSHRDGGHHAGREIRPECQEGKHQAQDHEDREEGDHDHQGRAERHQRVRDELQQREQPGLPLH